MAAVRLALVLAACSPALPVPADQLVRWQPLIAGAALRFTIPEGWILRVMRAESAGRTELSGRPIRSRTGAMGLMQLMPATWAAMRRANALGPDPDDPHDNIYAGAAYLRLMYDRFGYPGLFGAYNAGPTRYAAYLAGSRPLPGETVAYLGTVAGRGTERVIAPDAPPHQLLFALRPDLQGSDERAVDRSGGGGMFAVRKDAP